MLCLNFDRKIRQIEQCAPIQVNLHPLFVLLFFKLFIYSKRTEQLNKW